MFDGQPVGAVNGHDDHHAPEQNGEAAPGGKLAALERRLHRTFFPALREVQLEQQGDMLTLRGSVPSFYLKQVAQTIVSRVLDGHLQIRNELQVWPASDDTAGT